MFNDELVNSIVRSIELGMPWNLAADAAGIGRSTLHEFRLRGAQGEPPFAAFVDRLRAAEAAGVARSLATIRAAAEGGTWQASAWLLERRYPSEFGRRSEVAVVAESAQVDPNRAIVLLLGKIVSTDNGGD